MSARVRVSVRSPIRDRWQLESGRRSSPEERLTWHSSRLSKCPSEEKLWFCSAGFRWVDIIGEYSILWLKGIWKPVYRPENDLVLFNTYLLSTGNVLLGRHTCACFFAFPSHAVLLYILETAGLRSQK